MKIELIAYYLLAYYCNEADGDLLRGDAVRPQVTFLDPGTTVEYQPKSRHRGFFENDMRIYCYRASPKRLTRFFESIELFLEIENDEYTQYEGATPTEVRQHFDERRSLLSLNLFTHKRSRLHLSPFKQQCIGIDTELPYRVRLHQLRADYFRVIEFSLGICFFLFAGRLSQTSMFYYLAGVSIGICSSFMLIIWISSKLMPRRPLMYGMMIGGWTLGVYIIQRLWENLHLVFQMYRSYVLWYIFITGLLSFFFCYRIGPPKNQRSKNIVKWILQIMAITLIYLSSQYEEASVAIAVVTFVMNYFPFYIFHKLHTIYKRFFPLKRRLLTNDEYYEQGIIETTKALNQLRAYASSPDCKQWKIISKLSDPLRFASFVEGDSHLRDEEISNFECFANDNRFDETDQSGDEDASANFHYSCYKSERNDQNSEEEFDNENNGVVYKTSNAGITNMNNVNKPISARAKTRNFPSGEMQRPCLSDTYRSPIRKERRKQDIDQQSGLNPKTAFSQKQYTRENNKNEKIDRNSPTYNYKYNYPYEHDDSESDNY